MSEQRAEDIDDTALMAEVARGDTVAFERLIERHQALVIGTVGRMLGNNSEVEDVAQQVFIRVWKGAPRYRPTAKFTTWLLTITRNLVFNEARRRKRHPGDALDVHEGEEALALTDPARHVPDQELLEAELQEAIEKAIRALPEKQRMAVVLRRYEGKSYEEIGEVLGLTVAAVKSLLFRARTELRAALNRYLEKWAERDAAATFPSSNPHSLLHRNTGCQPTCLNGKGER